MNATDGLIRRPTRRHRMAWASVRDDSELVDVMTRASPKPKLVVLCGPSHAGKSSFAGKLADTFAVVSSETIRQRLGLTFDRSRTEHNVWRVFNEEKARALAQRRSLVLDACHMSAEARWHAVQGKNGSYEKLLVLFDVPLELVLACSAVTGRLPQQEAERMWKEFQATRPTRTELEWLGFNSVYVVGG